MGRKPIGKRAMTAAERQRKRRKAHAVAAGTQQRKLERANTKSKSRETYMPMPPGITYWRKVLVSPGDVPVEILQPFTKPVATIESNLDDREVAALYQQIKAIAVKRGLIVDRD